jgi:3-hydroxymyristoyl/3-hydroxydecanoyl-(acyl carrier protein) dehydratase
MKKLRRNVETDDTVVHDLDIEDICQLIPHRYPFLMVDRVLFVEAPIVPAASKTSALTRPTFRAISPKNPSCLAF